MALTLDEFLGRRERDRRLARLTHDVVLPVAAGLEFGAADNPTPLPAGVRVAYVDYAADARGRAGTVDHVWSGTGSLAAVCGRAGYDFAIAAQVAQYVPNLLGWFRGVFEALRVGGVLNLSLPDRRFMFDVKREVSTLGAILEADHLGLERPSFRQVFDHSYGATAIDPSSLWTRDVEVDALPRLCGEHALALAYQDARAGAERDVYTLCHCWVFTPASFLDTLDALSRLKLFPFVISQFAATEPGECEFFVCLRRDGETDPGGLLAKQGAAIAHVRGIVERRQRFGRLLARD